MQSFASRFLDPSLPSSSKKQITRKKKILIRPLRESDLAEAGKIFRLAFGTFLGIPNPETFCSDVDYVRTRWAAQPEAFLGAEVDGKLVGSNFATNWGSVGFFGPLTVHPEFWEMRIAQALLEATMEMFVRWKTRAIGLFTFAHSPKHIHLYQKFGFWPRYLTAILSKKDLLKKPLPKGALFSEWDPKEQDHFLRLCRALSDEIHEGLDLSQEIKNVQNQKLGETLLLWENGGLAGFAVCHCGTRTEAGDAVCYIKFGAVRPGPRADVLFGNLLDLCEAFAAEKGLQTLQGGMNLGRTEAYQKMKALGFRTVIQGVSMHHNNQAGYHRSGIHVIDDWR